MQVILMEKVINLGALGEVVKVKDGYARNYLIPRGKAKRVTEQSLKEFESKRAECGELHAVTHIVEKTGQAPRRGSRPAGGAWLPRSPTRPAARQSWSRKAVGTSSPTVR